MTKRHGLLLGCLGLGLLLSTGCERSLVKEPLPVGPSTIGLTFDLAAYPNVIYAGTRRATSDVRAVIKDNGQPVMNAVVYFTIQSGQGQFFDYSTRVIVLSNENGVAAAVLLGPIKSEVATDQDIVVRAQLETSTPNVIRKDVAVRVLRAPD